MVFKMVQKRRLISKFFTMLVVLFSVCDSFGKRIVVNGVDNQEIISLVKANISSSERQKVVSEDSISMQFIISKDVYAVKDILYSFGYFDAEVKVSSDEGSIVFDIVLKDRYRFNDILILYSDYPEYHSGITVGEVFELIGIEKNGYTSTREISEACVKLKSFYHKRGFVFLNIMTPSLELDKKNKKFGVVFNISLNKQIILDKTDIIIKTDNKEHQILKSFVRNRIEWKEGDVYNEENIEKTKDNLMSTGIFSSVDVKVGEPVQDPVKKQTAHSNVVVSVEESKLRDITVGLSFGTTEKFGAQFSWSHYNVDGKGSKFSTITSVTKKIQTQKFKYFIPDLFYKRQELKNQILVSRENVSAYMVKKVGAESILWQEVSRKISVGLGLCSEISKSKDKVKEENEKEKKFKYDNFRSIGIPFGITVDTTDIFLDPQSGFRCSAMTVPYLCKQHFTSLNAKGSFYLPLSQSKYNNTVVIACYSRIGSLLTSKRNTMPRDKLFFGGGANSIRGYGQYLLGNVNDDKKPLGGESVFEVGVEPRIKVSEKIGFVTFIEGGNVYNTRIPKMSKKLMWGGGFGVRYYTPLGPIRLDLAFPFKRRKTSEKKNIDSMFNIYLSIGQAF